LGTFRKLAVLALAVALAFSAPATSLANHGQSHGPQGSCPSKAQSGKKKAKGHSKKAREDRGKGRKCGHRTAGG
jgi:hypothetical protein